MSEDIKTANEEVKSLIKPVYEDLAQAATREVGAVLGRAVHALLFPVRGLCWGYEKIERVVITGLEKRLDSVHSEKLHTPEPEIAVPLIHALTYTAQNDALREMYLNLLANSMNQDFDKDVHPSYVEIIKQMNRLDALVFKKLADNTGKYTKAITPNISIKGSGKVVKNAMPEWFLGWIIENFDIFDISTCLVRLSRLGIVELKENEIAGKDGYDELKSSILITSIFNVCVLSFPETELALISKENILFVNEFGQRFAKACL